MHTLCGGLFRSLVYWGELWTEKIWRTIHIHVFQSYPFRSFILHDTKFFCQRLSSLCRLSRSLSPDPVRPRHQHSWCEKWASTIALSELDHDKIKQEPLKRNSDWVHCKTNAPKVCHMGGSWRNCAKRVCETWNHMSFSRLLVPFTVKTSLTRKDGSTFSVLQMNFGWGGRLSSCSCCRVDRNRSNRRQIWKMVTLSSWRTNPLHETIGSWPVSVKPIQVMMTYFERLKSQS